jgi:hypothetical protein
MDGHPRGAGRQIDAAPASIRGLRCSRHDGSIKENAMVSVSSLSNLIAVSSALATLNLHAHGHKKGSHVESTADSSAATTAKVPGATVQNLFGSLLQSLEQVVTGVSAAATAGATAATTGAPAPTAVAATPASQAASVTSAVAQAAGAAGYGPQLPKLAGMNISAKA